MNATGALPLFFWSAPHVSNVLGNYTPVMYANEALEALQYSLGMARGIHRDFDKDSKERWETIKIRRPSVFASQDEPSTIQDLNTDSLQLTLNKWRGVRFALSDKELTISSDKIIEDHIQPAAYEIARDIDADLMTLIPQVPWVTQAGGTFALADLTAPRQVLFDNGVPQQNRSLMVNGAMEAKILGVLGGANIMGAGVDGARRTGDIGQLYNFNVFANQQTPTFTTTTATDADGTVTGVNAKGVSTIAIGGVTINLSPFVRAGDTFVIAGNRQRYAVTANANSDGAGAASITFYPPLAAATAGAEIINFDKRSGGAKDVNLAYYKNFAALGMAPLSTKGEEMGGVRMAVATDDKTGLALRSRMWYDANLSKVVVSIDALWGKLLLDPNMACRFYSA